MRWIEDYQLFLFDFDGLLVNTEEIHYRAYQLACEEWGLKMLWTFPEYCTMAHYRAEGLREAMEQTFPVIRQKGWDIFYKLKTSKIYELVSGGQVKLMPGVDEMLQALEAAGKKRCVVTHSPDILVSTIRQKHAVLDTIPNWVTRESYKNPKPHPECYLKAIEMFALPDDKVLGFEDTPRGIAALMGTRATPVIICQEIYPELTDLKKRGVLHFRSFQEIPHSLL